MTIVRRAARGRCEGRKEAFVATVHFGSGLRGPRVSATLN